MSGTVSATLPRKKLVPIVLAGGLLAAGVLAASTTGTLGGFVATITNGSNTAASGVLTMRATSSGSAATCDSTDGGGVTVNAASCTLDELGGANNLKPGDTVATTVTIRNTGTVTASAFSLAGGDCTQSMNGAVNGTATDFCGLGLKIVSGATTLYDGTFADFKAHPVNLSALGAGSTQTFAFTVSVPDEDNTYQGLKASLPLTWTFNS